jgi:hypothetical protein
MSLDQCVLICRRSFSNECLIQSVLGVAVKGKGTWLLSPADFKISTPTVRRRGTDLFGNTVLFEVFTLAVGRFLDAMFPGETDFEVFRLHFDSYRIQRQEDTVVGEQLDTWKTFHPGEFPQTRILSIEHLWGGYYADRNLLVAKMRGEQWHDVIYRVPRNLAFSTIEVAAMDFLAHPGILPLFSDVLSQEIGFVEYRIRAEQSLKPIQVM